MSKSESVKEMKMFWDKVSFIYDFVETVYNKDVYNNTGKMVASYIESTDVVLECACGTGAISKHIATKCNRLTATDYANGMLRQARKNLKGFHNISIEQANLMSLEYEDESFDKVVAGNVIHLLQEPDKALKELERVVKSGGKIIIPTYINREKKNSLVAAKVFELFGADFKRQFDMNSYRKFFEQNGYLDVDYTVVEGKMPCCIAVITK